jgi:hypothetical protein
MLWNQSDVGSIQTLKTDIPIEEGRAQIIEILGDNMPAFLEKVCVKTIRA